MMDDPQVDKNKPYQKQIDDFDPMNMSQPQEDINQVAKPSELDMLNKAPFDDFLDDSVRDPSFAVMEPSRHISSGTFYVNQSMA